MPPPYIIDDTKADRLIEAMTAPLSVSEPPDIEAVNASMKRSIACLERIVAKNRSTKTENESFGETAR